MSEFALAFKNMIANEGGFVLHEVPGDRGGKTYAGISQRAHPNWDGWRDVGVDGAEERLSKQVYAFYKKNYWDRVCGDDITSQRTAESLFDFAVNAGVKTATKLAQVIVNETPDGIVGRKTVAALNRYSPHLFASNYAVAKIARYAQIVTRNPTQRKFLLGWINRTLRGLK